MKKLLLLAFVAIALFSCAKEDVENVSGVNSNVSLALKIEKKKFNRAVQDGGNVVATVFKTMILEVYDGSKKKIASKTLDATTIGHITSVTGSVTDDEKVVIPNVDPRAAFVRIWAYQAESVTNVYDFTGSVNDYQMAFASIPYYAVTEVDKVDANGYISIAKNATGTGGKKIWTAEASLAPYLARFELKPTNGVSPKTIPIDANDQDVFPSGTTIAVTGIYMNNIKDKRAGALKLYAGNLGNWGAGDWAIGHPYTSTGEWSNLYNASDSHMNNTPLDFGTANQYDTYNLFSQTGAPHVIVRVYVDEQDSSPYYGFITIKDFNVTGGGGTKLSAAGVQNGKIYRIDLDMTLAPSKVQPEPESESADLNVMVKIIDWELVNLTPEL